MYSGYIDTLGRIHEFQCISRYRKSVVNDTVCMFHFLGREDALLASTIALVSATGGAQDR